MAEADVERLERRLALLDLENRALRSRLAGEGKGERIAGVDDAVVPRSELDRLKSEESSMRRLLARLGDGPVGWLVRKHPAYRTWQRTGDL